MGDIGYSCHEQLTPACLLTRLRKKPRLARNQKAIPSAFVTHYIVFTQGNNRVEEWMGWVKEIQIVYVQVVSSELLKVR